MNYKQIILIVVLFLHPVLPVSAQYKEFRQVVFHVSEPDVRNYGLGRVVFFPQAAYPSEPDELFIATASSSGPQHRSLPKAGIHTLEINFSAGQ